jgi:tRNA threonylcarbamoyl adenosine modification protein YeaZ
MYSILIDTSDADLDIGLAADHKLIDEIEYEAWQKQSEFLVAELDKMFKKNGVTRKDIDQVIASKGPGSYTGVRIALTVAKVMAFALKVPLYLSSSLEAEKFLERPTICLMNARSKRSYFAVYQGEKILIPDQVMANEDVLKFIDNHKEYVLSGDAEYLGVKTLDVDVIGNLVNADIERNLIKDPITAKPVYLKDNQQCPLL